MMKLLGVILVFTVLAVGGNAAQYCRTCEFHTMCKTRRSGVACKGNKHKIMPPTASEREGILHAHNRLRNKVAKGEETQGNPGPQYSAANMMKMEWDQELAKIAQRLANQCFYGHDCVACRLLRRDNKPTGQNMAVRLSSKKRTKVDYVEMVENFYVSEVFLMDKELAKNFTSGRDWGHYSQIVWWNSRLVGCGASLYEHEGAYVELLVCNYRTGGNIEYGNMYEIGEAGTQCPRGTDATDPQYDGLCVMQSKPNRPKFHTDGDLLGLPEGSYVIYLECAEEGFRAYEQLE